MSRSQDTPHTHVPPDSAPGYLHRMVGMTLRRRGFDGAEAGALAETERLLELHILNLFDKANAYAHHSRRGLVNARDVLAAQQESGWDISTLRNESKRRRMGCDLATEDEPPECVPAPNIASVPPPESMDIDGDDVKPKLAPLAPPDYAWAGAPPLPDPWTYKPDLPPPAPLPPSRVTAGVLEFMKLTATERGDIPVELGLVDYRRADTRDVRRKWGVKGVGA